MRGRPASGARDHPRIRGEHPERLSCRLRAGGSSPHTRGARGASGARIVRGGIIPAYAGSTTSPRPRLLRRPDHPRIRGEHACPVRASAAKVGSSPHTRGALEVGPVDGGVGGIIPAYAGSTPTTDAEPSRHTDHPRIRGEH